MAAEGGETKVEEAGTPAAAATPAEPLASSSAAAAPAAGLDRDAASRTFFTTIDVEAAPKKPQDRGKKHYRRLESTDAGARLTEHHQDLITLANSLDQRMAALLREHEKDFFLAYKTHMYTVQKEIKTLRMKADHEEAKTREDTKIKNLEAELDWFMTEALRLDQLCKGSKKEVDKWKAKAEALDEDRRFLEDQIKGTKRQNKILRAASERARSSSLSALTATRGKEAQESQTGQAAIEPAQASRRPASVQGSAAGSGAKRAMEARSQTPDANLAIGMQATGALSPMANALALSGGSPGGRTGESSRALALQQGSIPKAASAVSLGSSGVTHALEGASPLGNAAESRYVQAIAHLKECIVREQQTVRMLQAARASNYSRKSELEEFFLKCIDEARKELMRRRHQNLNKEKSERERIFEALLSNEDVLVCLYEKLFPHRSGIARSLGALPGAVAEDPTMLAQVM